MARLQNTSVNLNDPEQLQALLDSQDQRTPFQKIASKTLPPLQRFVDFISTPSYAIGGILAGTGARAGIREKLRPSEALGITDKRTKLLSGAGMAGMLVDTLLDPLTYLSLGVGNGAKIITKQGVKTLTREGLAKQAEVSARAFASMPEASFVQKATKMVAANPGLKIDEVAQVLKREVADENALKYLTRLSKSGAPEAKRLFDQGGIKYFGKTIVPGESIAKTYGMGSEVIRGIVKRAPYGNELLAGLDEATGAVKGAFDSNYGKNIFFEKGAVQAYRDTLDYSRRNIVNIGTDVFKGATDPKDLADISYYMEFPILAKRYGDDLAKFPDAAIKKEVLEAIARVKAKPLLQETVGRLDTVFKAAGVEEQKANLLGTMIDDYVAHIYKNKNAAAMLNKFEKSGVRSNLKFAQERSLPTLAEAKLLGLDPELNAAKIYATRMMASQKSLAAQKLIKTAQQEFGANLPKNINPTEAVKFLNEYVPFADKSVGEIYLPREIVKSLEELGPRKLADETTTKLLSAYDKIQNFYKGSLTSLIPAFHGRNIIGNVSNSLLGINLDAINPIRSYQSWNVMNLANHANPLGTKLPASTVKELGEQSIKDAFGKTIKLSQLADELGKQGVNTTGFYSSGELGQDIANEVLKNLDTKVRKFLSPIRGGKQLGNLIETHARTQFYISKRAAGYTAQQAEFATKEFLFDYDNLTKFEKTVMRRAFPFYTFMRKNVALQTKNLLAQPVKYGILAQVSQKLGNGLSQEDLDKLPDYVKNQFYFVTGKNGKKIQVLANFGLPVVDAIVQTIPQSFDAKGVARLLEQKLSQGAFVPKTLLEFATGRDFFRGKAIKDSKFVSREVFNSWPKPLQDALLVNENKGKDFVVINPQMKKMLDSLPTSRAVNMFSDLNNNEKTALARFIKGAFGISGYNIDPSVSDKIRAKELQQKLVELGVLAEFTKTYFPED